MAFKRPFFLNSMTLSLPISRSSFLSPPTKLSLSLPFSHRRKTHAAVISACNRLPGEKLVVILGATGCGKSGLSVQLATRFPSEIINSDKMQVYRGLDITTNKIPVNERCHVPHHLLGDFDPPAGDFSPLDFRILAGNAVSDIASRKKLPILAGGSNSFIHSLLVNHYDPSADVFHGSQAVSSDLRYNCCFLWVDVAFPVLSEYLSVRVDNMLKLGMFEELAEFYNAEKAESEAGIGIRKAIGVPEFNRYFKKYPPDKNIPAPRESAYEEAVKEIKENTNVLAKRQIEKILKLQRSGWDINVLNATAAVQMALESAPAKKRSEIWEKEVLGPSLQIVKRFLGE